LKNFFTLFDMVLNPFTVVAAASQLPGGKRLSARDCWRLLSVSLEKPRARAFHRQAEGYLLATVFKPPPPEALEVQNGI
jgi:hypothetical protein